MAMGKGRGDDQRARSRSPMVLRTGAAVRLCGLKGAAHLNGMAGVCGDWDESTDRWVVRLDNGDHKSLKADNLAVEERLEQPEVEDAMSTEGIENLGRMASDHESGFVWVFSKASAQAAIEKKEMRLEFGAITDAEECARCLDLVCELLAADARLLRGLSFAACDLSSEQLQRLAGALCKGSGAHLTAFGVSKNPGVEQGAWQKLFEALPSKVMWLDFGDNQLTDNDVAPLIAGLEGRDDLDKLYLDGNRLRDLTKLCIALPDTGVTNLDIGDNAVDDDGAEEIAFALPQTVVTDLVMGSNPITKEGAKAFFKHLPRSSLSILYLDHTGVDDECLEMLGGVLHDCKLSELHIDNTKISDEGVRALVAHIASSELEFVDVSGNGVSDETIKLLAGSVSLQRGGDGYHEDEERREWTIAEASEEEEDADDADGEATQAKWNLSQEDACIPCDPKQQKTEAKEAAFSPPPREAVAKSLESGVAAEAQEDA